MSEIPELVRLALPERVRGELERVAASLGHVEELRLHCGRRITLTSAGKNIPTSCVLSRAEMDRILTGLCGGSVYAFRDSIAEGYISVGNGVRVGVCGRATMLNGRVSGVYEIDTLAVRIPHRSPPLGRELAALLEEMAFTRGMLIYSPPGVGKTTLLRSLAVILSSGEKPRRVSVIDTRGELSFLLDAPSLCLDILSGYPKHIGISIAARTLGSEVMICDEIGGRAEAEAICEAHNCGVPLIATAHAASTKELLGRSGMGILHRAGCFGAYVGLMRRGNFGFKYDICKREDADLAYLNACS